MEWPPQSPDLNIIEAVWDYLDRMQLEKQPTTAEELWDVLRDVWNNIPGNVLQKLQDSIPQRIDAVLKEREPYKIWNVLLFFSNFFVLFMCISVNQLC